MKIKKNILKTFIGILVTALLIGGFVVLFPHLKSLAGMAIRILVPFVAAYALALISNPLMKKMHNKLKIPRTVAALLVIIVVFGGLGSVITWVIMKVINELRSVYMEIIQNHDSIILYIEDIKNNFQNFYDVMPPQMQSTMSSVGDSLYENFDKIINQNSVPIVNSAGSIARSLPKILITSIVFILALFFMISDFETVNTAVKRPFSNETKRKFALLSEHIKVYAGGYLKAQLIIMSVVFIVLSAGLSILGVPFAMLIALGIAILDALPIFGSGAVLWPWSIISFITGNIKIGLGTIAMYVIILVVRQSIEPKIVSKNVGMNPILTLLSMYTGFKFFGIGGMIIGPITLMAIFSLYKATMFDTPIRFFKAFRKYVSNKYQGTKKRIIDFWEQN